MFNVDIKWSWLMTIGVIMLILGSLAIIFPAASSVSISLILGILLLIGAGGRLISMFSSRGLADFLLKLLVTVIFLAAGVLLLVRPVESTLTLTLLLGIFFVAQGIVNVLISLFMRNVKGWGWLFFNGVVAFILGALIWASWPSSAAWAIGLLVGIYLIFDGWGLIATSWALHHSEEEPART